jgi:hypothetical protein
MRYVATIHFSTDHPEIAESNDADFFALQIDVGNVEVTDFHIEPIKDEQPTE